MDCWDAAQRAAQRLDMISELGDLVEGSLVLLKPLSSYSPVLIHHLRRWHIARHRIRMARAREKSVEIKVEGAFHSGRYSVQGGIMTLHLGTDAKQARVGRACHRLLARILLYKLLRELQATRQAA